MKKRKDRTGLNPITLFIVLIIGTILLSALFSFLGNLKINDKYPFSFLSQGTYNTVNSVNGQLQTELVEVESLLNSTGIQYIISNIVTNLINSSALKMIIISLIGIAVADKSGLLKTIGTIRNSKVPSFLLTSIVIFLSVISTVFGDVGFAIMIPLSAILFSINKRNPIIGIIACFAGLTGGYTLNLIISSFDYNLMSFTKDAATLIDKKFSVGLYNNYFYMIVAIIGLVVLGTIITEKYISHKFTNKVEDTEELLIIGKKEKRGLLFSIVATVLFLGIIIYMIIPGLPHSGFLLDDSQSIYLNKLMSTNSYFNQGLPTILSLLLFISGLFYGIGTKNYRNDKDVMNSIFEYKNYIGHIVTLIFFASQFIAIWKKTNIGTIINIWLINILKTINVTDLPLIFLFFVFVIIGGLFLVSPLIRWSMYSPTLVPLFMQSTLSAPFAQLVFRSGASISTMLSPLFTYFVIYLGFLQLYNRKDDNISIGKSYKYLLPYIASFTALFLILIVIWYIIGLPIGPGVYPVLQEG